jgi:hypothetical protein
LKNAYNSFDIKAFYNAIFEAETFLDDKSQYPNFATIPSHILFFLNYFKNCKHFTIVKKKVFELKFNEAKLMTGCRFSDNIFNLFVCFATLEFYKKYFPDKKVQFFIYKDDVMFSCDKTIFPEVKQFIF